jgi:D-tyrosyl-tRNA(Tyr) deacylase
MRVSFAAPWLRTIELCWKQIMKALIQRVSESKVMANNKVIAKIDRGFVVFLGVEKGDSVEDIEYMSRKITHLRIFQDTKRKMNLSIKDINGKILIISQFTLAAECRKGNRPSFDNAEEPAKANEIYLNVVEKLRQEGIFIATGEFAAYMQVHLINDGPVTIFLESRKLPS